MNSYERLEAWQAAHQLALSIYQTTRSFPVDERYGLAAQLRRTAFSIPANIAEGSAKRGAREFARYLDIAVGSMAGAFTQPYDGHRSSEPDRVRR